MTDDRAGRDAAEQTEETGETTETTEAVETKRALTGAFGRAAPTYDRVGPAFFAYFGRRLAELAAVRPGERVLDVATGLGAALFPAVDAVGPGGSVVGVDLAEPMVQELTAEVRRRGLTNVSVRVMDAERLEFADGAFDAVLCAFALFFLPRRERALAEMHRVLRPGRRLAGATWGENDPRWRWYEELVEQTARAAATSARDPQEEASGAKDQRTPRRYKRASTVQRVCARRSKERGSARSRWSPTSEHFSTPVRKSGGRRSGRTARGCGWSN